MAFRNRECTAPKLLFMCAHTQDEDKTVLICPLCSAAHSLATGEVRGQQPQGLQGLTSVFFSRTIA
eukprot:10783-Eustigmatos_ZCMA.PRE.1